MAPVIAIGEHASHVIPELMGLYVPGIPSTTLTSELLFQPSGSNDRR